MKGWKLNFMKGWKFNFMATCKFNFDDEIHHFWRWKIVHFYKLFKKVENFLKLAKVWFSHRKSSFIFAIFTRQRYLPLIFVIFTKSSIRVFHQFWWWNLSFLKMKNCPFLQTFKKGEKFLKIGKSLIFP